MANNTGLKHGGRTKGTPNKSTTQLRDAVTAFVDKNWSQVQREFNNLDAKDKLQFIDRMLRYCLPQLQATTLTADFSNLSDEDLNALTERVLNG